MGITKKFYNDFSFGVVDRKFMARGDYKFRDKGFLKSENVLVSDSGSIIPRFGTKLIKDFGEDANIKCVPFSRGDNQKYVLVFKEGEQQIYYIDNSGYLVDANNDDVEQILVPNDLTSNTDESFNIVSVAAKTTAYTCFSDVGYPDADIYSLDISFPNPISLFRINLASGSCAVLQATFYKSTGESFTATATTEATTYIKTSCVGSSCSTSYTNGYINESSYVFEFPTGAYTYDDIVRVVIVAKRYVSQLTGTFPTSYTSQFVLGNGFLKKLQIFGTVSSGDGAVWNYDIPVDVMKKASYSITNRYIFTANSELVPYVISIFGAFVFNPISATFPTSGTIYNFSTMGYPNAVCCGQSRLWYAGFEKETTSILGSKVGYNLTELENFNPNFGSDSAYLPSSAVKFQPIDIRNSIQWIIASTTINFGSWDGIYKMTYGQGQPVSATGAVVLKQNEDTANEVFPAWYNGAMVFATISGDELRLMNYNMITERQESVVISKFHSEINGKGISKIVFKKDSDNYIFILYKDKTAAACKIENKEVQGFYPFEIADGIDDLWTIKTSQGEQLYFVVSNGNRTSLIMSDFTGYPKFPVLDSDNMQESMENISGWVQEKAILDCKVIKEEIVYCEAELPLKVGKLQTTNPSEVDNLIDSYPVWCKVDNFNVEDLDTLIGKVIIGEDILGTNYNFKVTIRKLPITSGGGGYYYFGVPYEGTNNDDEWIIGTNIDWAFEAIQYNIGITSVFMDYNQKSWFISENVILGQYCQSGTCVDNVLDFIIDSETGLPVVALPMPCARVVYGRPYNVNFTLGYIQQEAKSARRRISSVELNTYASWALKINTENTSVMYDSYLSGLLDLPFNTQAISQLVDMYQTTGNIFGLVPTPMPNYVRVKLSDNWSDIKNLTITSTLPYPFEIFNIMVLLEEENTGA